ncbi:acyl carrier protein [Algoriphagus sp. AK58]|uniref:acyl carrier protein n=1 Tax=Algoriphagus sp. AK58 TaxID=1406877 RepID=UPI00164FE073|nr:phosphopantetheine-binding protein [Algoriphagus sp. AK58]MBC6366928.1 phosphopantetheine-binding protein [Algoriphagus sp. AK58]
MTEEELVGVVFELLRRIAPETDPRALHPEENIRQALNIDSFDALQFIVAISEKLQVDIPEEDYGKTANLKSLIAYLNQRINK